MNAVKSNITKTEIITESKIENSTETSAEIPNEIPAENSNGADDLKIEHIEKIEEIEKIAEITQPVTETLPSEISRNLINADNFYKVAFEFQQIMMVYESAIRQLETKLDILNKENKVCGRRNPIETVKSRIKSPQSIAKKLEKKNLPVTFESMMTNLNDIAGIRVICPYISDIYKVRDTLLKQPDIKCITEKDYIKSPKESGYRSLHLVVEIPVYLSETTHKVRVEIQLRTIAMDFWACLEHELHYKTDTHVPESVRRELFRVAETIAMTDREMEEIAIELQNID